MISSIDNCKNKILSTQDHNRQDQINIIMKDDYSAELLVFAQYMYVDEIKKDHISLVMQLQTWKDDQVKTKGH